MSPSARLAVDLQPPSQLVHALANALQAEVPVRRARVARPQPASIVSHHEIRFVTAEAQLDVDAMGVGVLQRVGEPLETDTQEMVLLRHVQPLRLS